MARPMPRDPPVTTAVLPLNDMLVRIPRVTSAAIIGAGNLGGAVARALAGRESVSRIILIDEAASAAAGTALDIQQSGAIAGFHTRLSGTSEVSRAVGCDVCIVADPFAGAGAHDRRRVAALLALDTAAPIVFAGADHAILLATAGPAHRSRERLMGSCPEAFASAVRAMVALEAHCAPSEVMLTVLGAPPYGFVVPWSEACIAGSAAQHVLSPVQLARLDAQVERLWPPDVYALGLAAALVAEGVVRSARRGFSVLTILDGEFGIRRGVGVLPVLLSTSGIVHRRLPSLSPREHTRLQTTLAQQHR